MPLIHFIFIVSAIFSANYVVSLKSRSKKTPAIRKPAKGRSVGMGDPPEITPVSTPSHKPKSRDDAEAMRLEVHRIHDQEHYYRAPGGKCNTTELIEAELQRLNSTRKLTALVEQKLERGKCLWYTKTKCSLVPGKNNPKEKEYRCICEPGRTWENGACLGYHLQPCLWDNDCVFNAKCKFDMSDVYLAGDNNAAGTKSEQSARDTKAELEIPDIELKGTVEFDNGVCICTDFDECQREPRHPPLYDDGRGAQLRLFVPLCAIPFLTIIATMKSSADSAVLRHILEECC